jgi:ubiquinone/menaquinone biosynthesis C-methylase UbiE
MEVSSVNTYIFDAESPTELARLINQDRVITQAMGGPLSGVPDTFPLHNILDLGCGPGGWVLDVAFDLPDAEIEGIDASRAMVDYANARARTQRLPNASFGVMDMTHPFEIPDHSFELVNARFLAAVLKREVWPSFLGECTRVLRPGGFLRLTEAVDFGATTSEAVNQLMELTRHALYQLGYGFSAITPSTSFPCSSPSSDSRNTGMSKSKRLPWTILPKQTPGLIRTTILTLLGCR